MNGMFEGQQQNEAAVRLPHVSREKILNRSPVSSELVRLVRVARIAQYVQVNWRDVALDTPTLVRGVIS